MSESLTKNILSTIVYYDILDYPLTSFEIWKYLISDRYKGESIENKEEEYILNEVIKALDNSDLKKYIDEYLGFYFLKGRGDIVKLRIERNKISQEKYKLIRKIVSWLKYAPFVRMIAITGRVAMKNAEAKSDLDLFIAIKSNRLFIGRFFITLISQILAKRRHGQKITNRACLNYYISDKNLEIGMKDLFSSHEYNFIFPVYNFPAFQRFQENNQWIKNYRPNFEPDSIPNPKMVYDNFLSRFMKNLSEFLFDFNALENRMKKWQMSRIVKDPRTYIQGSAVMASDENLIFLPEPQGPDVYEKFQKKMEELRLA